MAEKCPLRKETTGYEVSADCLREGCAWWIAKDKMCCMKSLAIDLESISDGFEAVCEHGIPPWRLK